MQVYGASQAIACARGVAAYHCMLRAKGLDVVDQQRLDSPREHFRHGRGNVGRHESAEVVDDDAKIFRAVRGHLRRKLRASCEYTQGKRVQRCSQLHGRRAWANLSGTLLEKLQRFACGTAVRSKRQFAHDFGDLGHMREVARAGLVDVLL